MNNIKIKIVAAFFIVGGLFSAVQSLIVAINVNNSYYSIIHIMGLIYYIYLIIIGVKLFNENEKSIEDAIFLLVFQLPIISMYGFQYDFGGLLVGRLYFEPISIHLNFLFGNGINIDIAENNQFILGVNIIAVLFIKLLLQTKKELRLEGLNK